MVPALACMMAWRTGALAPTMLSLAKFMTCFLEHRFRKGNARSRHGPDAPAVWVSAGSGLPQQHVKIIDPSVETFVPRVEMLLLLHSTSLACNFCLKSF